MRFYYQNGDKEGQAYLYITRNVMTFEYLEGYTDEKTKKQNYLPTITLSTGKLSTLRNGAGCKDTNKPTSINKRLLKLYKMKKL